MHHATAHDGTTHINIGTTAKTALGELMGYYTANPKRLPDGKGFNLYAGYYYYLITAGDNPRFLRARSIQELTPAKRFDWTNVPGLRTHLESALLHNLRLSPIAIPLLVENTLPVVWEEPDRALKNAEKRWLATVHAVVNRLVSDYT